MPKLPAPPSPRELPGRTGPDVRRLASGTTLWRVYLRAGDHPTVWSGFRAHGPTDGRFDHHLRDARGEARHQDDRRILYAARAGPTAVAEAFQHARIIDRSSNDPWLVAFPIIRNVELLDLTGTWPTRAGASMKINSGPRPTAQRWSRTIHEAYPEIEGLYYCSSMHANKPCAAFYERAEDALPDRPLFNRPLDDPTWLELLRNTAADLGYLLV